jgi:hypothetical protein
MLFSASQQPFRLDFLSDAFTVYDAATMMKGFKLVYWQTTC